MTLEVTEENANNLFRFRMADGNFSDEIQLNAAPKAIAEENVVEEVNTEEPNEETAEETVKEVAEESKTEVPVQNEPVVEEKVTEEKAQEEVKETAEPEQVEATLPDNETLLAMGYFKVQVANRDGADVFGQMNADSEVLDHLEVGEERWLKTTADAAWAEAYVAEGENPQYILWDKIVITVKPVQENTEAEEAVAEDPAEEAAVAEMTEEIEEAEEITDEATEETVELELTEDEELPARNIEIHSTQEGMTIIPIGSQITLSAKMINFKDSDICEFQWQYLDTETGNYIDIEGENGQAFTYTVNFENFFNTWRLIVKVTSEEQQ